MLGINFSHRRIHLVPCVLLKQWDGHDLQIDIQTWFIIWYCNTMYFPTYSIQKLKTWQTYTFKKVLNYTSLAWTATLDIFCDLMIRRDTPLFPVGLSQCSFHSGVSPSSWLLQSPPHSNCTHFWISTCGSGISCGGSGQIVSHLCNYKPCSRILGYL